MARQAFKMKLFEGQIEEYQRRHTEIWPELQQLLKETGIHNYSIFLDEETLDLFGVMEVDNDVVQLALPEHPVMQKWWQYMKDIMETNPDASPVSIPLREVFFLK